MHTLIIKISQSTVNEIKRKPSMKLYFNKALTKVTISGKSGCYKRVEGPEGFENYISLLRNMKANGLKFEIMKIPMYQQKRLELET